MLAGSFRPRPSGQIIVCGQPIPVDWDLVYNFRDLPSFDATQERCFLDSQERATTQPLPFRPAEGVGRSPRRYAPRSLMLGGNELGRLQQVIRQFVVHHDGLFGARQCFHVLHDERGLSVHFIIDNDGTIYQTLDPVLGAYHASGVNACSIGVELCNRGKVVAGEEHYYRGTPARGHEQVRIHGADYLMWQFTEPQYQAMAALGSTLLRLFPNLPQVFPQEAGGAPLGTAISDPRDFSGYLGHYHVTRNKWDPGCFDFNRVIQAIAGKPTWFLMPGSGATLIDKEPAAAQLQAQSIVLNNRNEAMGGYFPVGPCGDAQVWHGGIHVSQPEGTPLYCPFPGRIAAARYGYTTTTGSSDFVLTEHRLTVQKKSVQFYLLLFHIDLSAVPPWLARARRRAADSLRAGEVIFPEVAVSAGELLGRIGLAGPPGDLEGQVHVEVIALTELGATLGESFFRALRPSDPGPLCTEREILGPLLNRRRPPSRPGQPAASALREFFQRTPDSQVLARIAARYQSEWVRSAARDERLLRSPEFQALPAPMAILRDQIRPTQWWTPEVARRVGLPEDGVVWHYHPAIFLAWMSGLVQAEKARAALVRAAAVVGEPQPATDGDSGELGYLDDEDRMSQEDNQLELEQIVEGWPDPPTPPEPRAPR